MVTFFCAVILMTGLFLMLLGGVGFVQDKRFFTSAPKEVQMVLEDKEERFSGQRMFGWGLIAVSVLTMAGGIVYGGWAGVKNDFGFIHFFIRFLSMLLMLKVFDVVFFDWILLSNAGFNFFPHFYPEIRAVLGRHLFGFNKREHIIHILLFIPFSALISWICTLF